MKKSRGLLNEIKASKNIHSQNTALLISPKILRSRGMGQVDLACYDSKNKKIILVEVKSSEFGIMSLQGNQMRRLMHVQSFLSQLFGVGVKLESQKPE